MYNKALKVYPKNPIALYEMGMTRIAMNPKLILQMKKDVDNYTYYVQARTHDPFMKEAHQGTNRITRKWLSIEKKIEPAMKALYSGTITCEALKSFAEGCIEIEQYEFAVYAYYQCMLNNYNQKTGFDLNLAEKISDCLVRLGAESAGNVFVRNIRKYNDVMKKQ